MKSFDVHTEARQDWLRCEQAPRVTPSESARQSNFEKSAIFRCVFVVALLFVIVDVLQDGPIDAPATAYHVTT